LLHYGRSSRYCSAISLTENITPRRVDRKKLQKELIANEVNLGQKFRQIPGLEAGAENFDDRYSNPELNRKKHVTIVQED